MRFCLPSKRAQLPFRFCKPLAKLDLASIANFFGTVGALSECHQGRLKSFAHGSSIIRILRRDSAMKRALLSLAIVGLVSLSVTQIAGAQERHRNSSNRNRVQSSYRVNPRGNITYGGYNTVYRTQRHSAYRSYYPSYGYYPSHIHRSIYYPRYQPYCAPRYRPPCRSPYTNSNGLGYSNGRVSFWIGF